MVGITHQKMTVIYFYITMSTSRAVAMWVFGFLSAGHGTKGFYQISIIMGISSPGAAKYHISMVHKTKGILAVTMEFSTGCLALCNRINLSGCGWLKPDQTSSSQFVLVVVHMTK